MSDDEPEDEAEVPNDAEPEPGQLPSAADPAQQKRIKNRARRERQEAMTFWRNVFADPVGRRVMWDILKDSHAFETRFACAGDGSRYQEAAWFQAGEAAFGHRLWKTWMKMARHGCVLMMTEHDPELRLDG